MVLVVLIWKAVVPTYTTDANTNGNSFNSPTSRINSLWVYCIPHIKTPLAPPGIIAGHRSDKLAKKTMKYFCAPVYHNDYDCKTYKVSSALILPIKHQNKCIKK